MSGIKDYTYTYTEERRRLLREALQALQQRRAAETQVRLAEGRRRARERIESIQATRGKAKRSELAKRARKTQESVEALRDRLAQSVSAQDARAEQPEESPPNETPEKSKVAELNGTLTELEAWRETLGADEAVQTFRDNEARAWAKKVDALLEARAAEGAVEELQARAVGLREDAVKLHSEAGMCRERFEARNELLADIIGSLKEIGFFVSDPYYQDPGNPVGPVVVKAARGGEEMTASVDLSETVKSVWKGWEDVHCKSAFWDYIERMKQRGVEITADRPDLRQRPILRQKGALDLPQDRAERAGG